MSRTIGGTKPVAQKSVPASRSIKAGDIAEKPKSESPQSDNQEENDDNIERNAAAEPSQQKSGMMYAVEADSFVIQSKASALVKTLTPKGYKAEVLKMQRPEETGSALYVVLIGVYDDLKKASDAASEFKKKEGVAAVVRPISSGILEESKKSSAPPAVAPEGDTKSRK
jgi:cell division septation protein DedD